MTTYHTYKDMPVWQTAMSLAVDVQKLTQSFPEEEKYGLISQMRRAAVSAFSNISEGFGRKTSRDKNNFYTHARGSLMELQSQLIYANRVGYLGESEHNLINKAISDCIHDINRLMSYLDKGKN